MNLVPLGDRLVLKQCAAEETTKSGIVLPGQSQEKPQEAVIVAVGKDVKAVCQTGCIGCGICQKNCPQDAIAVENFLAKVDYDKCTGCGTCKEKCPVKIIK